MLNIVNCSSYQGKTLELPKQSKNKKHLHFLCKKNSRTNWFSIYLKKKQISLQFLKTIFDRFFFQTIFHRQILKSYTLDDCETPIKPAFVEKLTTKLNARSVKVNKRLQLRFLRFLEPFVFDCFHFYHQKNLFNEQSHFMIIFSQ